MKPLFIILCNLLFTQVIWSQLNPLIYSLEYLDRNSQTMSRGMADIGVVAQGYNYQTAFNQNPALLARNHHQYDVSFSYLPLSNNPQINARLVGLTGFYQINEQHAIGLSNKFLSQGQIEYPVNGTTVLFNPFDNYLGLTYAYAPIENLSFGATAKYLVSRQLPPEITSTINSYAFDFGVDYRKVSELTDDNYLNIDIGAAITNLGPKVAYEGISLPLFLPTNFRIGTAVSWKYVVDGYNSITLIGAYQAEKLLIPTPRMGDANNNSIEDWQEVGVINALFSSWNDAPRGTEEELEEFLHRLGVEFRLDIESIQGFIALRGGIARQNDNKGNDRYYTIGGTINYNGFYFDVAIVRYQTLVPLPAPPLSLGIGFQQRF